MNEGVPFSLQFRGLVIRHNMDKLRRLFLVNLRCQ